MTTHAPTSPNSWPTSAKMKSLKAFGTKTRLSPRPVPKMPPTPSASRPWMVWKPVAQGVEPRVLPGPDPVELVAPEADRRATPRATPGPITARWMRLAPATKNIVNAVSVMTIGRAEVRFLEDEGDDRQRRS